MPSKTREERLGREWAWRLFKESAILRHSAVDRNILNVLYEKKNFFFIHFKVLQLHNCLKEIQHLVHISFTMSLALLWPFTPDSFSSPQGTPSSAL